MSCRSVCSAGALQVPSWCVVSLEELSEHGPKAELADPEQPWRPSRPPTAFRYSTAPQTAASPSTRFSPRLHARVGESVGRRAFIGIPAFTAPRVVRTRAESNYRAADDD